MAHILVNSATPESEEKLLKVLKDATWSVSLFIRFFSGIRIKKYSKSFKEKAIEIAKEKYPNEKKEIERLTTFLLPIKASQEKIKEIRKTATKLPKKKMKLESFLNENKISKINPLLVKKIKKVLKDKVSDITPSYLLSKKRHQDPKKFRDEAYFVYDGMEYHVILLPPPLHQVLVTTDPDFVVDIPRLARLGISKKKYRNTMDYLNDILNAKDIEDVKKETEEIRKTATKLPKKKLKLEGVNMKYRNLLKLIKKALLYKRKAKVAEDIIRLSEAKKMVPKSSSGVSLSDKRSKLKEIYRNILKGTPYKDNIPVFMELIDQVPEDYLNFELGVDFNSAFKVVDELIRGEGDLTQDELADVANMVSGIGIPAIEKHATGKHKLGKKTAQFGAEELSKSAQRVSKSIEQRKDPRYKLEAPKSKEVVPVEPSKELAPIKKELMKIFTASNIPKDSPFWKTASKLKSKGIDVSKLARSMVGSLKYSEAKEKATKELNKQGKGIEDLRGSDDLFNIWNQIKKQKEKVKVRVKR